MSTGLKSFSLFGAQSQLALPAVHATGSASVKMHACCKSQLSKLFDSWPLIGFCCGLVDVSGAIENIVTGFLPMRGVIDSIMNGSLGGTFFCLSPISIGQRPALSSPAASKYSSGPPLELSTVAKSCQGAPTITETLIKVAERGPLPARSANNGLSTRVPARFLILGLLRASLYRSTGCKKSNPKRRFCSKQRRFSESPAVS